MTKTDDDWLHIRRLYAEQYKIDQPLLTCIRAKSAHDALLQMKQHSIALVVLVHNDSSIPELQLLHRITKEKPCVKLLIVTLHRQLSAREWRQCRQFGAHAFADDITIANPMALIAATNELIRGTLDEYLIAATHGRVTPLVHEWVKTLVATPASLRSCRAAADALGKSASAVRQQIRHAEGYSLERLIMQVRCLYILTFIKCTQADVRRCPQLGGFPNQQSLRAGLRRHAGIALRELAAPSKVDAAIARVLPVRNKAAEIKGDA